jgi:hypothetical protein
MEGKEVYEGEDATGLLFFLGGFSWIVERGVEFGSWTGSV